MSSQSFIEFDLQFSDYNKITILVFNLLEDPNNPIKCDIFSDKHCHHLNENHLFNVSKEFEKCTFCKFVDLLRQKHTIKISNDVVKSSEKHCLNAKYKTHYAPEILEWAEFQTWRSPYVLIGFATCNTQAELLSSIKNFEKYKELYKKTLVSSKLFIDLHNKHEMNEDFKLTLNGLKPAESNSSRLAVPRPSIFEMKRQGSVVSMNSNIDVDIQSLNDPLRMEEDKLSTNLDDFTSSTNTDLFNQVETKLSPVEFDLDIKEDETVSKSDEKPIDPAVQQEIDAKLKILEKDKEIVYLDFLFAKTGADKIGVIIETEKSKIEHALQEAGNAIFKKLYNLTKLINGSDEKQLNYYSEYLKSPIERNSNLKSDQTRSSDSTISATSFLSIKVINKKVVSARMNKFKGDLYMQLNMIEHAFSYYAQSFSLAKKEQDFLWASSALEGMCVASYFYFYESKMFKRNSDAFMGDSSSSPTLKEIKSTFKSKFTSSSKDLTQKAIPASEFAKNFEFIISNYNKSDKTKFMAFETALMISKFFISNNFRYEGLVFTNYAIYISNLQIREEFKMRRYLEIAGLYERCELKRLASFYKWISTERVFRLLDNSAKKNINLKCLVKRCSNEVFGLFEDLKILPQKTPAVQETNEIQIGYPYTKKHLVSELIQLFRFNNDINETIKYSKYFLNELLNCLNKDELNDHVEFLTKMVVNNVDKFDNAGGAYESKFYKLPVLSSFKVLNYSLELNRMDKIKVEDVQSKGIYIVRYENPLLSSKKKTIYKLPINQKNKIEMLFSNPIPIDLFIESINLIAQAEDKATFMIPLFLLSDETKSSFTIPAATKEFKVEMGFLYSLLGNFKIVGYEFTCFKCKNEILFTDFNKNESSNGNSRNINKTQNSIQPSYDIEMIPKLYLIKDVCVFLEDHNKNQEFVCGLAEKKNLTISSNLGTCQIFNFELVLDEAMLEEDLKILKFDLTILNEFNANKCKASLSMGEKDGIDTLKKYFLKVDTTNFYSDSLANENELDVNCMLEIKYTNKIGEEHNLCHILKTQIVVKFVQTVFLSLSNIADVNENEFEMDLLVKNLTKKTVYLEYLNKDEESRECVTNAEAEKSFKLVLKKFDLDIERFESTDYISKLLDERLKLKFSLAKNIENESDKSYFPLKFQSDSLFLKYKNRIFKTPVKFYSKLGNSELSFNNDQFLSLMLIGVVKINAVADSNYVFTIRLDNKLNNKIFSDSFKWILKEELDKKRWAKEFKIISNEAGCKFSINLSIKNSSSSNADMFEWSFNFNSQTNSLSYALQN